MENVNFNDELIIAFISITNVVENAFNPQGETVARDELIRRLIDVALTEEQATMVVEGLIEGGLLETSPSGGELKRVKRDD